ncbi:MAG: hypothetical protein KC414_07230 [Romboutsia sp.]|nr:hypothetical protein [Romboutsia sp.]
MEVSTYEMFVLNVLNFDSFEKIEFEISGQPNCVEVICHSASEGEFGSVIKGKIYDRYLYKLNKSNYITQYDKYKEDKLDHRHIFEYDNNYCLVEYSKYNSKGERLHTSSFQWRHKVCPSYRYEYDKDGKMERSTQYFYDPQYIGIIKHAVTESLVVRKREFTLFKKLKKEIFLNFNHELKKYNDKGKTDSYKYDKNENCIEYKMNMGNIYIWNQYLYDEYNNIVQQNILKDNGEIRQQLFYKIFYDSSGNWIKKIKYYRNNLKELRKISAIIERRIEY